MIISIDTHPDGALLRVRLDPHDGACRGTHDVVVVAMPLHGNDVPAVHVTLAWGPNAPLSIRGSEQFLEALKTGIEIAKALALASSIEEAGRMADDVVLMLKSSAVEIDEH